MVTRSDVAGSGLQRLASILDARPYYLLKHRLEALQGEILPAVDLLSNGRWLFMPFPLPGS